MWVRDTSLSQLCLLWIEILNIVYHASFSYKSVRWYKSKVPWHSFVLECHLKSAKFSWLIQIHIWYSFFKVKKRSKWLVLICPLSSYTVGHTYRTLLCQRQDMNVKCCWHINVQLRWDVTLWCIFLLLTCNTLEAAQVTLKILVISE